MYFWKETVHKKTLVFGAYLECDIHNEVTMKGESKSFFFHRDIDKRFCVLDCPCVSKTAVNTGEIF